MPGLVLSLGQGSTTSIRQRTGISPAAAQPVSASKNQGNEEDEIFLQAVVSYTSLTNPNTTEIFAMSCMFTSLATAEDTERMRILNPQKTGIGELKSFSGP